MLAVAFAFVIWVLWPSHRWNVRPFTCFFCLSFWCGWVVDVVNVDGTAMTGIVAAFVAGLLTLQYPALGSQTER